MTTTIELQEQLNATYGYTYGGIPVIELGDAGDWIITIGHVDKTSFANAVDAYYRDVNGDNWPRADVSRIAEEAKHRKALIVNPNEFLDGECEFRFDEGDIDVTTWAVS